MNFRTNLSASSARWAAPFALGLALFYYFGNGLSVMPSAEHYAPALASTSISTVYAVAYAVAAGLAAWESGRVARSGVWLLAPARSRYRIALNALTPALLLAWLMLCLPVALALGSAGTLPTLPSLGPLVMALLLCCAHSAIGFAIGMRLNPVIAAPILAVVVWVAVAFSWATDTFWLRHVLGQYPTDMDYGEAASLSSLLPHILLTGGLALAVALWWLPIRYAALRAVLCVAVAVGGPALAHRMTADWGPNPPLLTGQVDMRCLGKSPRVCMPEETSPADIARVRRESVAVLTALSEAGVPAKPAVITDRIVDGRFGRPSTDRVWRVSLTDAVRQNGVRYRLLAAAVRFPCSRPDTEEARPAMLWAAAVTGQADVYQRRMAAEDDPQVDNSAKALATLTAQVRKVREQPAASQARWFEQAVTHSCARTP
ncbi:hypothetical protein ACFV9W_35030 [Streptomyces sp. NPDC059897]|uniref:hypothetical protein n=1 Tax=Streptomyces sp. NPDC059897 TaxID=3346994 RepID=UPI0036488E10